MTEPTVKSELSRAAVEPLLPIEKKLIGGSLALGVALLIILAIINHLYPAT